MTSSIQSRVCFLSIRNTRSRNISNTSSIRNTRSVSSDRNQIQIMCAKEEFIGRVVGYLREQQTTTGRARA